MRDENPDRFADQLLDATLAQYQSAEPRWGLEERILANLRTQAPAQQRMWWKWRPVLAATATVMAVVMTTHLVQRTASPDRAAAVIATNIEQKQETGLSDKVPLKPNQPSPHLRSAQPVAARNVVVLATKRELPAAASLARRVVTASEALTRQIGAQTTSDLRIEELRISDFNLKEIVINKNEQEE